MTIRETNDLLAQTRLIVEEHRDEVQIFQSQISAMSVRYRIIFFVMQHL